MNITSILTIESIIHELGEGESECSLIIKLNFEIRKFQFLILPGEAYSSPYRNFSKQNKY